MTLEKFVLATCGLRSARVGPYVIDVIEYWLRVHLRMTSEAVELPKGIHFLIIHDRLSSNSSIKCIQRSDVDV